jgi:hypothetical protein
MIFLGVRPRPGFLERVLFAEAVTQTFVFDLNAYPRWLLIAVGTLVAVIGLWIVMKLLKLTLWLLMIAIFLGGLSWAAWELLQ